MSEFEETVVALGSITISESDNTNIETIKVAIGNHATQYARHLLMQDDGSIDEIVMKHWVLLAAFSLLCDAYLKTSDNVCIGCLLGSIKSRVENLTADPPRKKHAH